MNMPTPVSAFALRAGRSLCTGALLALLFAAGCVGDDVPASPPLEVYENGRAEVLARTDSGRALRIEHEPFDSVMTEPMVMELRLADPREARGIQAGDKIRFNLVLDENYRLRDVETLPASTRLHLTADTATTDTATTDTAATGAPASDTAGASGS